MGFFLRVTCGPQASTFLVDSALVCREKSMGFMIYLFIEHAELRSQFKVENLKLF
jgi:hypothetical protein